MALRGDSNGNVIQVFAPLKFVSVTAGVAWEPAPEDRVFLVPVDCNYQLLGAGDSAALKAEAVRGIAVSSYEFDTTRIIEVM